MIRTADEYVYGIIRLAKTEQPISSSLVFPWLHISTIKLMIK